MYGHESDRTLVGDTHGLPGNVWQLMPQMAEEEEEEVAIKPISKEGKQQVAPECMSR